MKELKGTQTEANLLAAFAGESMARNKYTFYAAKAKKEGLEQISGIFAETADNEKEHAKIWYKLLHSGIADTETNLLDAANGEHAEWADMYARFAEDAKKEGFQDIATLFQRVGEIERTHEERYLAFLDNVKNGEVFAREGQMVWVCRNCGHVHYGNEAPEVCPVCAHPQAFFELKAENY